MEVILREHVDNLGKIGDLVSVRDGYGRNYLIPKGLAILATKRNVGRLAHERKVIGDRAAKHLKTIDEVLARIESCEITISKRVGSEDRIFGSVTTNEIVKALATKGPIIDRKKVEIDDPIRTIGEHEVRINLGRDRSASLKLWVVAQ